MGYIGKLPTARSRFPDKSLVLTSSTTAEAPAIRLPGQMLQTLRLELVALTSLFMVARSTSCQISALFRASVKWEPTPAALGYFDASCPMCSLMSWVIIWECNMLPLQAALTVTYPTSWVGAAGRCAKSMHLTKSKWVGFRHRN